MDLILYPSTHTPPQVYRAVDKQSGVTIALKVYRRAKLTSFERTQVRTLVLSV